MRVSRLVVYTCITGGYDDLRPVEHPSEGVDYVCITDRPQASAAPWVQQRIPAIPGSDAQKNRYVKMHAHELFPAHDTSVYVDGSIRIVGDIAAFVQHLPLDDVPCALFEHPFRHCTYAEAAQCSDAGLEWRWKIEAQMLRYRAEGFPQDAGLFEANVIVRNHRDSRLAPLMQAWWREYCTAARRDQLALPFLAWKLRVPILGLGASDARFGHRYLQLSLTHNRNRAWLNRWRRKVNSAYGRARRVFEAAGVVSPSALDHGGLPLLR